MEDHRRGCAPSAFKKACLIMVVVAMVSKVDSFSPSPMMGATMSSRSVVTPGFVQQGSSSTISLPKTSMLRMSSSDAAVAPPSSSSSGGDATMTQLIFNLVKGIVGAGVLGLPAGICAFGNAPSAAVPAVILVLVIGMLSAYGFGLIGRVCGLTDTTSLSDAWSATISEKTSWIPALSITLMTISAVLAYSMILGDTFSDLLRTYAGIAVSSGTATLGVTGTVLLPLCLLKNLSSLAPFSLLGTLGMIYTAIAMTIRYVGGAYKPGGKFATDLAPALRPSFGTTGAAGIFNPNAAILLGMLGTAYMAHFNAPKFYTELKDNTIPRYMTVVLTSFAISMGLFASMTALGFLTFGSSCSGVILNNYSGRDTLMSISKVAVAISLVCSYPLAFTGARDGILDLFKVKDRSATKLNALTVGLLSAVTGLALIIPDVSFVLSFAGATLGNAMIYIYPALLFRGAVKKMNNASASMKREVKFALASGVFGLGMGILGAKMAIQSLFV